MATAAGQRSQRRLYAHIVGTAAVQLVVTIAASAGSKAIGWAAGVLFATTLLLAAHAATVFAPRSHRPGAGSEGNQP